MAEQPPLVIHLFPDGTCPKLSASQALKCIQFHARAARARTLWAKKKRGSQASSIGHSLLKYGEIQQFPPTSQTSLSHQHFGSNCDWGIGDDSMVPETITGCGENPPEPHVMYIEEVLQSPELLLFDDLQFKKLLSLAGL